MTDPEHKIVEEKMSFCFWEHRAARSHGQKNAEGFDTASCLDFILQASGPIIHS